MGAAAGRIEAAAVGVAKEVIPKKRFDVALDLEKGLAQHVWLEVGRFDDIRWLFGTQRLELSGDPRVPGATRTYNSGGVEKLLSLDEAARRMTWDLSRFAQYEGGIHVTEDKLNFWIEGKVPLAILHIMESIIKVQLDAVLSSAKHQLKLSKALIATTTFPMKDPDAYEKVVEEKEKPALKKLMASGDLLQFRLELDKSEKMVRAYEVWKDSETQAHHMSESFFADIMGEIAPYVDMSRMTGKEVHSWSEFGPKFEEHAKRVPKIFHRNSQLDVFVFKSVLDIGRDNLVLYGERMLETGVAEECARWLKEMQLLSWHLATRDDLLDVRFHLDDKQNVLYGLQVFRDVHAFERMILEENPYKEKISSLARLAKGPSTGSLWGPAVGELPERIKVYCEESGIRACKANLIEVLSGQPQLAPRPAEVAHYSRQTKNDVHKLFEQLDRYTWTMLSLLPRRILRQKQSLLSDPYSLKEPSLESSTEKIVKLGTLPFRVAETDDHFGNQTRADSVIFKVLSNPLVFPIDDKFIHVPDDLVECMKSELLFDKIIPPSHHYFTELSSDVALERAIMSGVFSLWLRDDDANSGFKVDYSFMEECSPRKGFHRLGATAYLDGEGKLTSIRICDKAAMYKPGDVGWNFAKMVFKVSAAQFNTAVDHLAGVHMLATNPVINSAIKCLPLTHTIRRMLQPFSFRSVYVNNRASKSLLDSHSIVLHACGYDPENFGKLLEIGVKRCDLWLPPPERIDAAGKNVRGLVDAKRFPYGEDSIRLYEALRLFVAEWVGDEYASDEDVRGDKALQSFAEDLHMQTKHAEVASTPKSFKTKVDLVRCLATFCFNATGMHQYAGTVQEYILHPSFMGFRLGVGSDRVDMQTWLLGLLLFSVTSQPMPDLLDDFKDCYTKDTEQKRWKASQERLRELSGQIDQDNASSRQYHFNSFNPSVLQCSVNV